MSQLPRPLPSTVVRIYRRISYGVRRSVEEENKFYDRLLSRVGLAYTPPDTSKQEDTLIAVKIAKVLEQEGLYEDYIPDVCRALDVKRSTYYKYRMKINELDDITIRDVDFIRSCGKPRKFPLEADAALVQWIKDPNSLSIEMTMTGLKRRYKEFMDTLSPVEDMLLFDREPVNEDSLRFHIQSLVKQIGMVFKKPKTVDTDRLHIFDSLQRMWHDPTIRNLILETDHRLLFNADETSVCRIIEAAEKVVCAPDDKPTIPAQVRDGNHITLFPIISAAGEMPRKRVILHCEREDFVDESLHSVETYRTENGYMDQKTFVNIMRDIFIPFVNDERRFVSADKQHAVLIVDGHISRYALAGLNLLREHDIDLLIIPAHTSHVCQPLDLGLNHFIKLFFRKAWASAKPRISYSKPEPGRPAKRQRINRDSCTVSQIVDETPEETEARATRAVYRRAKVVQALLKAVEDACTHSNIQSAFKQAHLVPLLEDPPYTREKEEKLIQQALAAGIALPKETDRKNEHIIGIVTSDQAMEKIKARPDLIQYTPRKRGRPRTSTPAPSVPENDGKDASQGHESVRCSQPTTSTPAPPVPENDADSGCAASVNHKRKCTKRSKPR